MARKVKKIYSAGSYDTITHTPLDYYTQTPGNYDIDNYYLRELQDKVDAEWALRPNRVITEYEVEKASKRKKRKRERYFRRLLESCISRYSGKPF